MESIKNMPYFNYAIPRSDILSELVSRECDRVNERFASCARKKIALFCAGTTGIEFANRFVNEYGLDFDYWIDNDLSLTGKTVRGRPILSEPWRTHPNWSEEYAVIVASSHTIHKQIQRQLLSFGMADVLCMFSFELARNKERILSVCGKLDDETSKCSYLGASYAMMTDNNNFINFAGEQYFSHRNFINTLNGIVVDAGAFVGDSMEVYIKRSFGKVKVYAFEPFDALLSALQARKARLMGEYKLNDDDIIIVPAALDSKTTDVDFRIAIEDGMLPIRSPNVRSENVWRGRGNCYSLDDYFKDKQPPTHIKADIEGMELAMLKGALRILTEEKPKLAISIYHSPSDMASIVEYIDSLSVNYKFAIRNHSDTFEDTVLYCWI
jgi:FkbM family methyltransferase